MTITATAKSTQHTPARKSAGLPASIYLINRLMLFGENRGFGPRSLFMNHPFKCTPTTKDAQKSNLQDFLGDSLLLLHVGGDFGLLVSFFCMFADPSGSTASSSTPLPFAPFPRASHNPLPILPHKCGHYHLVPSINKKSLSRENRGFQLRSRHINFQIPCAPYTKCIINYILQDIKGDLVPLFSGCGEFGL